MRTEFRLPALLLTGTILTGSAYAQVPVDDAGSPYSATIAGASIEQFGDDDIPLLGSRDLETLVGPVALYPDTLLAVILPAAAYPLQIVQAARFLDELEADPTLTPSPDWDESVVALLNYPDVLRQLNDDIDWTLELGEAVIAQQADVLAAVQRFRDRAYVAGNLESDSRQRVTRDDSIIEIDPVDDSALYVPVYRPERVILASSRPVYTYRANPYPVYYYPYPDTHAFSSGFFWGVTTAYALQWHSHRIHVVHHSLPAHPYYQRYYGWRWWYRRPTLAYHNHTYFRPEYRAPSRVRNRVGDYWVPRQVRRPDARGTRVTNTLRRSETYTQGRVRHSSRSATPPAAIDTRHSRSTPVRPTPAATLERARQTPSTVSSRRAVRPERAGFEPDAYVPPRSQRAARDSRPQVRSDASEAATRYRRSEPTRQIAAPKPASRAAPTRPATRSAPARPAARSPSITTGARSVTREAPRRGARDTARHRLRRD